MSDGNWTLGSFSRAARTSDRKARVFWCFFHDILEKEARWAVAKAYLKWPMGSQVTELSDMDIWAHNPIHLSQLIVQHTVNMLRYISRTWDEQKYNARRQISNHMKAMGRRSQPLNPSWDVTTYCKAWLLRAVHKLSLDCKSLIGVQRRTSKPSPLMLELKQYGQL